MYYNIYIYIYIYICMYVCVCVCMYAYIYIYMYMPLQLPWDTRVCAWFPPDDDAPRSAAPIFDSLLRVFDYSHQCHGSIRGVLEAMRAAGVTRAAVCGSMVTAALEGGEAVCVTDEWVRMHSPPMYDSSHTDWLLLQQMSRDRAERVSFSLGHLGRMATANAEGVRAEICWVADDTSH